MLYFKINEYLTLKLEHSRTNIYVKGRLFNQCKYLLLDIPTSQVHHFDTIESIDEAADRLNRSLEGNHARYSHNITAKAEFWGHCSNLQAWAENGYDTRLLHRNLAFPLLKALVDAGDPQAKKVFKEQIALRIVSGYPSVVEFLSQQGYLQYLTSHELQTVSEDPQFITALLDNFHYYKERSNHLTYFMRNASNLLPNLFLYSFSNEKYHQLSNQLLTQIRQLRYTQQQQVVSKIIDKLEDDEFYIDIEDIVNIFGIKFVISCLKPQQLNYIFKHLIFRYNLLKYGEKIIFIDNYDSLDLSGQGLKDLTKLEGLENFSNITKVILDNNSLSCIRGLEVLQNIEELSLQHNNYDLLIGFERFPELKKLNLAHNNIKEINGLKHLNKLESLDLSHNKILEIDCSELPQADSIHLEHNLIVYIDQEGSHKFQFEFQISENLSVSLDNDDITISINQEPAILIQQDRLYVYENGIFQRQNKISDSVPGFCEIEYFTREDQEESKSKVYITDSYPLTIEDLEKVESQVHAKFRVLCTNLKLWAEHKFDFRLLRKDIAFPLLYKLAKIKNLQIENTIKERVTEIKSKGLKNNQPRFKAPLFNGSIIDSNSKELQKKFYTHNNELFATMTMTNPNTIQIKIINPYKFKIRETSEPYLQIFLKEALLKVKEENPNLNVQYTFVKNTPFIENITISHILRPAHLD
ncbi:MAG: leucine-rich repeat domain-containing protein, partial [Candidatus Heimdallarchaeota archaeon]